MPASPTDSSSTAPAADVARSRRARTRAGLGCAALVVVMALLGAFVLALGLEQLADTAWGRLPAAELVDDIPEGVAARRAAIDRRADDLAADHPFVIPDPPVVGARRARRFMAAVDDASEAMAPWLADLASEPLPDDAPPGEVVARATRVVDAQKALLDVLEARGMSLAEFVWTGERLQRAFAHVETGAGPPVSADDRRLAKRYRRQLEALAGTRRDASGPPAVWALAAVMLEGVSPPSRSGDR